MKKNFFIIYVSKKPGFLETSRPWMVLIFTTHIEGMLIHLYITKKKTKKRIFCLKKGGGPHK
jgi:hypothetical protein